MSVCPLRISSFLIIKSKNVESIKNNAVKTIIVTITLFLVQAMMVCAQKLSVSSFEVSQGDILARTSATCRFDTNDKYCALIKVGVALDGVEFECSGGVIDVVRKTGEYWLYLPQNNSKLRILHKDYTPLEINFYDYGIGKLESGVTYVLTLMRPNIQANHQQEQAPVSTNAVKIRIKDDISIEMVKVEAGSFVMGAIAGDEMFEEEKPAHKVTLEYDYYIGKYEVTQALWKAVMGDNPSNFKGDRLPVENVSWEDCQIFIRKLNKMTKKHFALPTEAQWEFAARGGNYSKGYLYSGSDVPFNVAWYKDNAMNMTQPVGTKRPNELGIYDMSGNVLEWCQDQWDKYSEESQINPLGPMHGDFRVVRGGGWANEMKFCRSSYRGNWAPNKRHKLVGFRLKMGAML